MKMFSKIPKIRLKFFFLLAMLVVVSVVQSQSPHTEFVPIAERSLSSSFGRCFLKDSKGYMWIGTADGLMRYDGFRIYSYEHNPQDRTTIPNNNINVIVEDAKERVWVGTSQGLVMYDREKDKFINVDSIPNNKSHLNNRYITSITFDANGNAWIGTLGGGVNVYDEKASAFTHMSGSDANSDPVPENYITSVLFANGLVWSGTKGGLQVYDADKKTLVAPNLFVDELPSKQITQIVQDVKGDVWFSTIEGEIIKASRKNLVYSLDTIISPNSNKNVNWTEILTMSGDSKGNFWVGGENSGLSYFDTEKNTIVYFGPDTDGVNKMPTNSIRSVYVDNNGLVWIGTFSKGVYLVDKGAGEFDDYTWGDFQQRDLEGKDVRAFAEAKNGDVWMIFDGVGLVKLEKRTNSLRKYDQLSRNISVNALTALVFDKANNLWLGTGGNGLYKININTNSVTNYSLESGGFGDNKVFCLYVDKQGTLWAGTNGSGLFYFDRTKQQFVVLNENHKENFINTTSYISAIQEDYQGALWVATMYGLYKITKDAKGANVYKLFRNDVNPKGLKSSNFQYVYEDTEKNLWVGTSDAGLYVKPYQEDAFKAIKKEDGLPSNTIRSIVEDEGGNLWVGGNMGLSKIDAKTNKITNYVKSDGLASNSFHNQSIVTSYGKLFFGTNNGFNAFYPENIETESEKPKVYLTDLKINNKSVEIDAPNSPLDKHISLASNIELEYGQRSFALDYIGLNYGQPFAYDYCYKLEGFDDDWNCVGGRISATYTNINPGNYTFLVKASNKDGVWGETPQKLNITVYPLVWKTWWAVLIYIIFISALIYFLISLRVERIRMRNQLDMERLAREQDKELSEQKSQFFTNISHEFRTPLSLISMPLENLSSMKELPSAVKERIKMIRTSSDKMMRLVNELMDFNKLESAQLDLKVQKGELVGFISNLSNIFKDMASKRSIHFGTHSMVGALEGWFDHDKLEKILTNLLSNAFKFTLDNGKINVIINSKIAALKEGEPETRCLELSVVDDGIGIPKEELPYIFDKFYQAKSTSTIVNQGTGIGLSLTKGLVELHKGQIRVESNPNQETVFVILIPIDKECYNEEDIVEIPGCIDAPQPITEEAKKLNVQEFEMENEVVESEDWDEEVEESKSKPQILVVEDNEELRNYICLELKQEFNTLEAKNGQEGLELALEHSPDLIISDIIMPIKSGIELCEELKKNIKTSHIPFILLTARTTVEDQISGVETGADVYITKPFSIRFLLAQVNQIIESRQKLYTQYSQDLSLMPNKMAHNEIDQAFLQKAIDYIKENMQNPQLGVIAIAELFNLSRMQIYRKIKALTGKSVVNFIRMVKIKEALRLMDAQKYTLTEISYMTGFNSPSYFTTSFKEEYGKSPSEYLEEKVKT
ncbi:response regulator [Flavobacteriaceae bacterium XHP0103]|uniref:hybrid sensor histidine kinase/response regulator transcription factor n=1 Tax=Marixanthotalea marina TaxID=2844359 RepID=UPI002989D9DC|nr:two-component regulator propeller domain-containing protein [Marixanthotalea marina]MBU3821396.1 response regulator [Marixanthotalea marina]